jgi:RNA polymerase sigma-70 factor (ECF subfamily)
MTDAALIDRWLAGDSAALDLLVGRHAPWLTRWLAIHLPRAQVHDAEDLAQEVFVVLFRKLEGLRGCENLSAYLRGVARKVLWRHVEKMRKSRLRELTAARQESQLSVQQDPEEQERLEEAIRALPEELELTVLTYYSRKATYEEVAELLGVSRATVQSRLRRALALLRAQLARECPPSG